VEESSVKVYGYRRVMLFSFMLVVATNQLLWISFAPITSEAAAFYGVSNLSIGVLSMVFMVVFVFLSIPASWVIDTCGIRAGLGIGALLTGVFGLLRGLLASHFTWVFVSQIGIAVGQPFVLNAIAKIAGRWLPLRERATASGLCSLATYAGILVGLAATPLLVLRTSLPTTLLAYGGVSAASALVFLSLARGTPAHTGRPRGKGPRPRRPQERASGQGLCATAPPLLHRPRRVQRRDDLDRRYRAPAWVLHRSGRPRRRTDGPGRGDRGSALPSPLRSTPPAGPLPCPRPRWSDPRPGRNRVRQKLRASARLSLRPGDVPPQRRADRVQYGAELTHPVPEETTNGLLLLAGQVSGIAFIVGMDALKTPATGSITGPLLGPIGLLAVAVLAATRLKESTQTAGR